MDGVIEHTQFHSQLDAVDRATPLARMGRGKISPTRTQQAGPQVEANAAMYRQVKTIRHMFAALEPSSAVPTMATMNSQTHITTAPYKSRVRLPKRSIVQNEMGVHTTLTIFMIVDIRNEFDMPTDWKKVVP
jgi:hypothetical protein